MHLHGFHFQIAAFNGRPWLNGPMKDTVLLGPGETSDLIFVADQTGHFPLHDHFETANTNNGVWLGGMHTMVMVSPDQPATNHEHVSATAPTETAGPPPLDGPTVLLRDNFYAPNQLTVPIGTTVRWEHRGQSEHTVSHLLGQFDSGPLQGGDVFTHTFRIPGRYDYFCRFHITNRGTVVVQ